MRLRTVQPEKVPVRRRPLTDEDLSGMAHIHSAKTEFRQKGREILQVLYEIMTDKEEETADRIRAACELASRIGLGKADVAPETPSEGEVSFQIIMSSMRANEGELRLIAGKSPVDEDTDTDESVMSEG